MRGASADEPERQRVDDALERVEEHHGFAVCVTLSAGVGGEGHPEGQDPEEEGLAREDDEEGGEPAPRSGGRRSGGSGTASVHADLHFHSPINFPGYSYESRIHI